MPRKSPPKAKPPKPKKETKSQGKLLEFARSPQAPKTELEVIRHRYGRVPKIVHIMDHEPEAYTQMRGLILFGCSQQAVAEAMRLSKRTFYVWMSIGKAYAEGLKEDIDGTYPYRQYYIQFYKDMSQSGAHARIKAEMEVRKENPLAWLRANARTRPGDPGWTEEIITAGDPEMPLMIEHQSTAPASQAQNLIDGISVLQQLGILSVQGSGIVIEGTAIPTPSPTQSQSTPEKKGTPKPQALDEEDDDEEEEERSNKGYYPDKSIPLENITHIPNPHTPQKRK